MTSYADQPNLDSHLKLINTILKHKENICNALEFTEGTHNFDDVVASILAGTVQFWDFGETCVITELVVLPRRRSLHVFLAGGNKLDLIECHPTVIAFARANGCTHVTISGRAGWERALKHVGWKHYHSTLILDIQEGAADGWRGQGPNAEDRNGGQASAVGGGRSTAQHRHCE